MSQLVRIPGVPQATLDNQIANIEAAGGTVVRVEGPVDGKFTIFVRFPRTGLTVSEEAPPSPTPSPDSGTPSQPTDAAEPIAWGASVSREFKEKVVQIAAELGCDPNFLMAVMHFESAGTFSPSVQNQSTNATGLIQFLPSTAVSLGTTVANLMEMTAVEQLDFVLAYFKQFNFFGRLRTLSDVYMAVLLPVAVGKAESFVLFSRGSRAYELNKALDRNEDGNVTKNEAAFHVQRSLDAGLRAGNLG